MPPKIQTKTSARPKSKGPTGAAPNVAPTLDYIGRPFTRVEDPRLIRGIATYVDDMQLPGLLHAVILRSPYAHARVMRIDTAAATKAPGVRAVYTGPDVNPHCGPVPCGSQIEGLKAPKH